MNTYDTYDYVASFLAFIFTGLIYGIFPVLFMSLRKTSITAKKLNVTFILEGIGVHILCALWAGTPEAAGKIAPIFIWTSLYIAIARKVLKKKNLLIEGERIIRDAGKTQPDVSVSPDRCKNDVSVPTTSTSCISCGVELSQGDAFCNRCGASQAVREAPLPIRFCRKCGQQLKQNSIFCSVCGEKLTNEKDVTCTQCKSQIPMDSVFCPYCGTARALEESEKESQIVQDNQSKEKASDNVVSEENIKSAPKKSVKKAIYIVLPVILLGYIVTNLVMGTDAEREGNYIKAKRCFDNLLLADTLAPEYMKYIDAGVWMNNGNMYQAYLGFSDSNYDIPQRAWDRLYSEIYAEGVRNYRKGFYSTAKWFFEKTNHYSNSDDYLFLLQCRSDVPPYNAVDRLKKLFYFSDAKDLLVYSMSIAGPFLEGEWKGDSHYFRVTSADDSYIFRWDLPQVNYNYGNIYISDGILSLGENQISADSQFKISVVRTNTIKIYCYANSTEYTLYRSE